MDDLGLVLLGEDPETSKSKEPNRAVGRGQFELEAPGIARWTYAL